HSGWPPPRPNSSLSGKPLKMRLSSDSCAEPLLPAGTGRTGMLFPPRRVLRRSAGPGAGVSDQSPDLGCRDGGGGVQAALADRAVFQSLKAKSAGEDLHRDFRQCPEDASLGGVDCHVADQVPAVESHLRLVAFQSGGAAAAAVVRLP